MCGIAGYIPKSGHPSDSSVIRRMSDRLRHRGPDDCGYFVNSHVALGHRRLSIIDLSGGAQPISNEDGTVHVVFNGEIYNYQEIRRDLKRRGHRFKTESDTETLVHLYEDYGERLPEHLNGMFAFAIWDEQKRELLLGRDRMGEKPLYYAEDTGDFRVCFASELRALQTLPGFSPQISARAISDFLCLSYIPDPSTVFEGVYKLPPAHTLTCREGGTSLRRYWTPPFHEAGDSKPNDLTEAVHELCADSVARRMISDVPLGAFLSGGVDSSAVVALMANRAGSSVRTFSIGFDDPAINELTYAQAVVDRYQTHHRSLTVKTAIDDMFEPLIQAFDEPFGDSSAIPMMHLSKLTRAHVTVALTGDGGDELFGGYRRYRFGVIEENIRARMPQWFRRSVVRIAGQYYPKFDYLPQVFRAKTLLTNIARDTGDAYFHSMSSFPDAMIHKVLAPEAVSDLKGYSSREAFAARMQRFEHLTPLRQMQAIDLETYLPGDILVKTDRTTMAYSLEARCPWLDHRIVELAGALPSSYLIQGRSGKAIFKNAMGRYLPSSLLNRRKQGFSVPMAAWLRTSLRDAFSSYVFQPGMQAYYSIPAVRRLWEQHQSGLHDHSRKLWNLMILAAWMGHQHSVRSESAELFTSRSAKALTGYA